MPATTSIAPIVFAEQLRGKFCRLMPDRLSKRVHRQMESNCRGQGVHTRPLPVRDAHILDRRLFAGGQLGVKRHGLAQPWRRQSLADLWLGSLVPELVEHAPEAAIALTAIQNGPRWFGVTTHQ
jgi:hypothetical protein